MYNSLSDIRTKRIKIGDAYASPPLPPVFDLSPPSNPGLPFFGFLVFLATFLPVLPSFFCSLRVARFSSRFFCRAALARPTPSFRSFLWAQVRFKPPYSIESKVTYHSLSDLFFCFSCLFNVFFNSFSSSLIFSPFICFIALLHFSFSSITCFFSGFMASNPAFFA